MCGCLNVCVCVCVSWVSMAGIMFALFFIDSLMNDNNSYSYICYSCFFENLIFCCCLSH